VSALAIVVGTPAAPPRLVARVLASVMRDNAREARAFLDRNADTWREALAPGEQRFVAVATDRNGRVVFVREYARAEGTPAIEHGRECARRART
jgi:hypothetical protein